jgi:hypothetical protein
LFGGALRPVAFNTACALLQERERYQSLRQNPVAYGKLAKQIAFFELAGLYPAVLQVLASNFVTKDYKNTPLTPRLLKNYD